MDEKTSQPFDMELAEHYGNLIDEGILATPMDFSGKSKILSTETEAIKILSEQEGARKTLEQELEVAIRLRTAGVNFPQAYCVHTSPNGTEMLIMDMMPKLTPYGNLNTRERKIFDKQYATAISKAKEHRLTPIDLSKHDNCGWDPETKKIIFYDGGSWELNTNTKR